MASADELLREILRRLDRIEALLRVRKTPGARKKPAQQIRAPRLIEVDDLSRQRARQALRRLGLLEPEQSKQKSGRTKPVKPVDDEE